MKIIAYEIGSTGTKLKMDYVGTHEIQITITIFSMECIDWNVFMN